MIKQKLRNEEIFPVSVLASLRKIQIFTEVNVRLQKLHVFLLFLLQNHLVKILLDPVGSSNRVKASTRHVAWRYKSLALVSSDQISSCCVSLKLTGRLAALTLKQLARYINMVFIGS